MTELRVEHFPDPTTAEPIVAEVARRWKQRQLEDLVALVVLLRDVGGHQAWADDALTTLERLGADGRHALVTDPSLVSWQQLGEAHLHRVQTDAETVSGSGFVLEHFSALALAAAVSTGSCEVDAALPANCTWTLAGTDVTVRIGRHPVRCRWASGVLAVNGTSVPLSVAAKGGLWDSIAVGPGWRALATPRYGGSLEHDARSPYLTDPFAEGCDFDIPLVTEARALRDGHLAAFDLLQETWPELRSEILRVNRHVVSYIDSASPAVVSSFSNNGVPGALYVCRTVGGSPISLGDLLDSIVHEHSHQKLYLLEALCPLYDPRHDVAYPSPWKQELRPIGGLLHGFFVFGVVARFWLRLVGGPHPLAGYAARRVGEIQAQVEQARLVLEAHAPFTSAGKRLFTATQRLRIPA